MARDAGLRLRQDFRQFLYGALALRQQRQRRTRVSSPAAFNWLTSVATDAPTALSKTICGYLYM